MTKALGVLLFAASLAPSQSGMKEVIYEVDGTAKYANLTLTNPQGGKEQNQVKLSPHEGLHSGAEATVS